MNKQKNSLGKGLAALLGDIDYIAENDGSTEKVKSNKISINLLRGGKMQPRQVFDDEKLSTLVESIRDRGILQPILVRSVENDRYEIIAGERRWRAAQKAGLTEVPINIYECSDKDALEVGLIENLQRDDLNPIEEGESLRKLMNDFNKTQDEVAKAIRKSRSYVANIVRLSGLPDNVKQLIKDGKISAGHARALITAPNIDELVEEILNNNLTVRETEERAKVKKPAGTKVQKVVDPDIVIISEMIKEKLGLPTKIDITQKGGYIKISFETYEQLDQVVSKIQGSE